MSTTKITAMTTCKVEPMTGTTTMTLMGGTPFYDTTTKSLYYTDVICGQIFRLDTTTHQLTTAKILGETCISFIVPCEGTTDQFIIGAGKRLLMITWDGIHTTAHITRVLTELPFDGVRFTEGTTDTRGRLFCGTMLTEETGNTFDYTKRVGGLYRYTLEEGLVEIKTKIGKSTGITFNDKTNTCYHVDSYDLKITQFGYDVKTGTISGEKTLTDLTTFGTKTTCTPHGLTTDHEGNLYVTMNGGSKIIKVNTT